MKRIFLILFLSTIVFTITSSCNDEWTDELYVKLVSFKAPVGNQGVADIHLRYKENGEVRYELPVIISGSQPHTEDIDVNISVDKDTLDILNDEKFQFRTDLYYKQLPNKFFKLPSHTCHVPAGKSTGLFPIDFKFSGLDLVEKWVLPLKIVESKSKTYSPNYRHGWRIALLRVIPFNDYSGTYSATSMNIYIQGNDKTAMVQNTRLARVVNENTVFFYAGMVNDKAQDREKYKIYMRFEQPDSIATDSSFIRGKLTVKAANDNINFQVFNTPTYEIRVDSDQTKPYLIHRFCTVNIDYQYNDITSTPGLPITFKAEGSMTMERQINTLIPDRDQAILW